MTRLFQPHSLFSGKTLTLDEGQTHYLYHVLRKSVGDQLTIFNEQDGEWEAIITTLSKTVVQIRVGKQIRVARVCPNVSLLFALLKHDPLTFLVEKAAELGVRHLYPMTTKRCNISRLNPDRLLRNLIDAAQQCERFDIPRLHPLMTLGETLAAWDPGIPLFVCQERAEKPTLAEAMQSLIPQSPAGFAIGPEGGFSSPEIHYLESFSFIRFISLGPRILRAETAALTVLACYQALVGDCRVF